MLQNTRTQTYNVSSPSMKPTQIQHQIHLRNKKHKFRNTKVQAQEYKPKFKHKHKIRSTRAQIQEHKPIFQHKHKIRNTSTYPKNSKSKPKSKSRHKHKYNRISTSFKMFIISSIFLLAKLERTKKRRS